MGDLGGLFYAVGGRERNPEVVGSDAREVDVFDPATNTWQSRCELLQARHRPGVAVLDGCLFSIGGASGKSHLDSVERYVPERNQWEWVASMSCSRVGVAAAVVNRLLYAIGGFNGIERLASVECFHPEKNEWIFVRYFDSVDLDSFGFLRVFIFIELTFDCFFNRPMNHQRSGAGVVALGQYIYVAGGMGTDGQLNSLERYDTEKDVWCVLNPMTVARSALTLAVLDNKIYAMGG